MVIQPTSATGKTSAHGTSGKQANATSANFMATLRTLLGANPSPSKKPSTITSLLARPGNTELLHHRLTSSLGSRAKQHKNRDPADKSTPQALALLTIPTTLRLPVAQSTAHVTKHVGKAPASSTVSVTPGLSKASKHLLSHQPIAHLGPTTQNKAAPNKTTAPQASHLVNLVKSTHTTTSQTDPTPGKKNPLRVVTGPSHTPQFTLAQHGADKATSRLGAADATPNQVALLTGHAASPTTGQNVSAHATQPATTMAPAVATLHAELGSPAWQQQLGRQLARAVQQGHQQVQLHLHPQELGPLQISLHVDQQKVQAQFFAAHVATRDAVQQALPQLRSSLANQGMALADTMVGHQQQHSSQQHGQSRSSWSMTSPQGQPVLDADPAPRITHIRRTLQTPGKLDLYA